MAEALLLLQDIGKLRNMMTDVATGKLRIQDGEAEYTKLRSSVATELKALKIKDPNNFHSLWDWYGHWKAHGLSSYQERREYIGALYRPAIEAIEALSAPQSPDGAGGGSFSRRHGFSPCHIDPPVTVYEDAPPALRRVLIDIATQHGWDADDLLSTATRVGKQPWEEPQPIQSGKSSRIQLDALVSNWPWYRVYDFIEMIADGMSGWTDGSEYPYDDFERILNQYFRHAGIGWQLENFKLKARGSEAFRVALARNATALKETPLQTAQREVHEAITDLSRRPDPDLTGGIQHAMAALECVLRVAANDPNPTLGKLLKHHPGLIPPPLDTAIEKAWGYASNMARHIEEGNEPTREEAELVVGVATTVATYLSRKYSPSKP